MFGNGGEKGAMDLPFLDAAGVLEGAQANAWETGPAPSCLDEDLLSGRPQALEMPPGGDVR